MAIGTAFAAGSGIVKPRESYVPLINALNRQNTRRGGRSSGIASSALDLKKRQYDDMRRDKWSAENQERGRHAGSLYTDREWQSREAEKNRDLEREKMGISKDIADQQSHEQYMQRLDQGEADRFNRGIANREMILKEKKGAREGQLHDLAMDQQQRAMDHKGMMDAFMMGDTNAVTSWFVKNAPKGDDGSQKIPTFEFDGQNYSVTWPGSKEPVAMDQDSLGRILQSLSPKYERPISEKERAGIEKDRAVAAKYRSDAQKKTGITGKERMELLMEDAANQAEFGESYQSPFNISPGEKSVVRTGKDSKGRKVVQYSDGSIEYADKDDDDENKKKSTDE